jgi:hypothetical protein
MEKKTGSLIDLIQIPSVIMISIVIVVISNTWGFLDPTLEPHLREVMCFNYLSHRLQKLNFYCGSCVNFLVQCVPVSTGTTKY